MAQLVKCLLCKNEDLNLSPRNHIGKSGMVVGAYHSNTGEEESHWLASLKVGGI